MSNELMRDFSITSQTLGVIVGFYFYSYAFMQLPAGVLLDYFGPRSLLTLATLTCALSTIAFGYTSNVYMASLARLMIGFGSAFAVVGTMKLAANWFPAQRFALLTGIMVTVGMLGAIGGETPLALLIEHYNWRNSMLIMGIVGLILASLIFLITRDKPAHASQRQHLPQKTGDESILKSLIALFQNSQIWLVATYGGFMYMWTPVFCGLWGVPFLMIKHGLSKPEAANYISLILVGWAVASPLWGIFSNRIGRRKPPMLIGSIGALISALLIIYSPLNSMITVQISLFLFGVFSAGFLPAFSIIREICDERYVATGLSFMNMMNMIGIALIHPLIGSILHKLWLGEMGDGIRVYSLTTYYKALALMPLGILISLIILPFIKETYCHNQTE